MDHGPEATGSRHEIKPQETVELTLTVWRTAATNATGSTARASDPSSAEPQPREQRGVHEAWQVVSQRDFFQL